MKSFLVITAMTFMAFGCATPVTSTSSSNNVNGTKASEDRIRIEEFRETRRYNSIIEGR